MDPSQHDAPVSISPGVVDPDMIKPDMIKPDMVDSDMIIVGIDDSPQSRTALRWAADLARRGGQRLEAVHVNPYDSTRSPIWAGTLPGLASNDATGNERNRGRVVALFDEVDPEPAWRLTFADGSIGSVLVHRARTAQLLVVGTREHRGINRLLSGSVSHYCLTHSLVPVAAVPTTDEPQDPPSPDQLVVSVARVTTR